MFRRFANKSGSESVVMYAMWYTRVLLMWCRSVSDIYCHAQEVADEAGSKSVVMYAMWYTRG